MPPILIKPQPWFFHYILILIVSQVQFSAFPPQTSPPPPQPWFLINTCSQLIGKCPSEVLEAPCATPLRYQVSKRPLRKKHMIIWSVDGARCKLSLLAITIFFELKFGQCHLTHSLKMRQETWHQDGSEQMWVFFAKSRPHPPSWSVTGQGFSPSWEACETGATKVLQLLSEVLPGQPWRTIASSPSLACCTRQKATTSEANWRDPKGAHTSPQSPPSTAQQPPLILRVDIDMVRSGLPTLSSSPWKQTTNCCASDKSGCLKELQPYPVVQWPAHKRHLQTVQAKTLTTWRAGHLCFLSHKCRGFSAFLFQSCLLFLCQKHLH